MRILNDNKGNLINLDQVVQPFWSQDNKVVVSSHKFIFQNVSGLKKLVKLEDNNENLESFSAPIINKES